MTMFVCPLGLKCFTALFLHLSGSLKHLDDAQDDTLDEAQHDT